MRVVSGLIERGGKVLMGKRPQGKLRPGLWEYPGGKVEPGEHAHAALVRELVEELGVTVAVGKHLGSCRFALEAVIDIELYHVLIPHGVEPEPREHDELQWVRPEDAVRFLPCSPGTYLVHQDVLAFLYERDLNAGRAATLPLVDARRSTLTDALFDVRATILKLDTLAADGDVVSGNTNHSWLKARMHAVDARDRLTSMLDGSKDKG